MSFDIPVIFDDSPFFEWGDKRRQQSSRNRRTRQPSLFDQWAEPEFFYDYPTKKHHYRPNRGRQAESKYEKQQNIPQDENRFQDEGISEEDIDHPEEHRRIRQAPRVNFGLDGWDIPVQYVGKPTHTHPQHKHQHKHKPKAKPSKARQDLVGDSYSLSQKASTARESPYKKENETEQGNDAEEMKVGGEKQQKASEQDKIESHSVDDTKAEASTQTTKPENNENIEIPISYSPPKNTRRRLSKRLSQCDPPSSSDIKLARIKSVVERTEGIEEKIAEFVDPLQNKNYLYISETLMKILLDLDTIDSEGIDIVRKARKEGVQTVQALVDKLEKKLEANKQNSKAE